MRFALTVGLALAALSFAPTPAPAERADDRLVEKVRDSIDAAVKYLKSQQRGGNWEVVPIPGQRGGCTSLVLLALLTSGVKPTDPAVQRGLEYLRGIPPDKTYVVGLQTMVFAQAKQAVDRERIRRNVDWLLSARLADGWSYSKLEALGRANVADNSNTQYALLGLHEAIQSGVKVSPTALQAIRRLYIRSQSADGGWGYRPSLRRSTMTMTSAGLCNLIITGMDLAVGKQKLRRDGSAENCGEYVENEPAARALTWLGDRFPARLTAENAAERLGSPFYCLYGIERVGRLTGQRYLGGHDWYEVGCRFFVETQRADGSWEGSGGRLTTFDHWPVIATSFGLLFLSKGRTPVLLSKLAYGGADEQGWNNKRNDVRHLTEFASRELFKGMPLAWQAFDVRTKEASSAASRRKLAAELLQSPIAYFNGHDFAPRGKEEEILKEYVANGGFILAENCCGRARHPRFDRDFRALMRRLFPDAELKPLPPEHPVWLASGKFAVSPKKFPLEGINQGCKTVVIYSPTPLAGYWEGNLHKEGRGRDAFRLGANIIAYATGLEPPRPRLSEVTIVGDDPPDKVRRGFFKVAQLRHEGDWQPAPRAMRNLMGEARKVGLDVVLATGEIYPSSPRVLDYYFFYMHGRNAFSEKKEDLKKLRFRLKAGGTLLADACCGSKVFDRSFRRFIEEVFGEDKLRLQPIPLTDELFSKDLNGTAIRTVRCRRLAPDGRRVVPAYQEVPPALEGIKYKGRWVVIYSRYDIGCALEGHASPDCLGHDKASAVKLARAAVLYALKR
jgi:hypothetical protein